MNITLVPSGGFPVVLTQDGFGLSVQVVASGGIPCTPVSSGGFPIVTQTISAGRPVGLLLALTNS